MSDCRKEKRKGAHKDNGKWVVVQEHSLWKGANTEEDFMHFWECFRGVLVSTGVRSIGLTLSALPVRHLEVGLAGWNRVGEVIPGGLYLSQKGILEVEKWTSRSTSWKLPRLLFCGWSIGRILGLSIGGYVTTTANIFEEVFDGRLPR